MISYFSMQPNIRGITVSCKESSMAHMGLPQLLFVVVFFAWSIKRLEKAMAPHSSTLATSWEELTHWKRLWCWEGLGARGERDDRGWDGWMASLTRWTWVWVNSGSWWWTGRPGVLRFMGLQRVGHDWATDLIWSWGLLWVNTNDKSLDHKYLAPKGILRPRLICLRWLDFVKTSYGTSLVVQWLRGVDPWSGFDLWSEN